MKLKFKTHQLVDLPIGTVSEKIVGYIKELQETGNDFWNK